MNRGVNKVILIGNLCFDPEHIGNNNEGSRSVLAITESRKDQEGNKIEYTEFVNLVFWGKTAESFSLYGKKGQSMYIEGKLKSNIYKNKDGYEQKSVNVMVTQWLILKDPTYQKNTKNNNDSEDYIDENIPF